MSDKVTIILDGVEHRVDAGTNLLQACLSLQKDLPYFCWHPAMGSAGACRQCAVIQYQNAEDQRGRLVMSCMTPVSDGMIVSLNHAKASDFRATTIAALMTNHPHDCPVCEEGGDCHLQDMTLLSGHIRRQYPGHKRTHLNQYLGPLLNHEMNRCIGCYRCVRFYKDYCGGDDLGVFASRNRVYFGRAEPGTLQNEFSGNLAEVCPTGVFTDKPFSEHYVRKWDLATSPTVCTHCAVGCNSYTAERGGVVRKVNNRHNPQVNGHFLCDRGRFGYAHVNQKDNLQQPWLRPQQAGQPVEVLGREAAEQLLAQWVNEGSLAVVGSARSSLENNVALYKLASQNNFYAGINDAQLQQLNLVLKAYKYGQLKPLSVAGVEQCDAIVMIGEDPTHTAPRLALAIRQMTRNAGLDKAAKLGIKPWQDEAVRNIAQQLRSPLHIIATHQSRLADVASQNIHVSPDQQMALLLEVEQLLKQPDSPGSNEAKAIAADLSRAKRPALITGCNSGQPALLRLCVRIGRLLQQTHPNSGFYCAAAEANAMTLALLSEQLSEHQQQLQGLDGLLQQLAVDPPHTLLIMQTDLYRYFPPATLDPLLDKVKRVVVLEQRLTDTAKMADLLLPCRCVAQSHGYWLNSEGRLQLNVATMAATPLRLDSYQWLQSLTQLPDRRQLIHWCSHAYDLLRPLRDASPTVDRDDEFRLARQPLRASSRTAIHAAIDVKEYPPASDSESPLNFSMEGVPAFRQQQLPQSAGQSSCPPTGVWSPKWNSSQAINVIPPTNQWGLLLFDRQPQPMPLKLKQAMDDEIAANSAPTLHICPRHHIYSDDELAAVGSALVPLMITPQAWINPHQAVELGLAQGQWIKISTTAHSIELPWSLDPSVADNVMLVPLAQFLLLGPDPVNSAVGPIEPPQQAEENKHE